MAAGTFYIKKNDTAPFIRARLTDADGTIANLSGATIRFLMRPKTSAPTTVPTVASAGVVEDAQNGIARYEWATGDTEQIGKYRAEFEVTFASGRIETFPNSDYIEVRVVQDLDQTV